ncbi:hypothetical protein [Microbacterium sp. SORGH_AS_0888]|uniref:hypothetical protein n=1 Tax=Microbacterium sp. SORGH_AS_0888 TaxID=3041791 RepID=UPI00278238EC|nr:hypothetical protein [Microbacterium sp. SORGH_AS_0888]MDQ1128196.1 putative membrane protein YeaQ/YmgE (transglycosylase-associated protein family) [Microbacterium sp. SORGH_AS_0888]
MDIVLAFLFGLAVGLIAHYALPGRAARGTALLPAVGAVVGGAVWTLMTWTGATTLDPWIWLLSAIVPAIVVVPLGVVLTRIRAAHDARERERLKLV